MTKKDKAIVAEGLQRICADLAVIASLFGEPGGRDKPMHETEVPAAGVPNSDTAEQTPICSEDPPAKEPEPERTAGLPKTAAYEEVRAVLAEKARTGFRAEVKALLTRYGARQLSEITDPVQLGEILSEAEAIEHG